MTVGTRAQTRNEVALFDRGAGYDASPGSGPATRWERVDPIDPAALADLMLASALFGHAEAIALAPASTSEGGDYQLTARGGSAVLGALRVPADVGAAIAARLAIAAGLDPFVEATSFEGRGNVARVGVAASGAVGEVLIAVGATALGFDVEIRPLSAAGSRARRPSALRRCGRCGAFYASGSELCEADGAPLDDVADDPAPGGTIGVHRILDVLGEGGMGTVYGGEHALIGRPVAVKVLHRALADNPALARRFLTEARAASRVRHPNVVEVTDFGILGDGRPFMVMERLSGVPLDARLRAGALPPVTALRVAREVALALAAAHDGGVLHNDLKPSNILLVDGSTDAAPRVKLLDFGAASLVGEAGDGDPAVIGTPRYMSPERVRGEPVDSRADLYSLGVVLYEMVSGRGPLDGVAPHAVMMAQMTMPPPLLTSPYGALPQALTRLVARALAKKPGERHQSAREMVADLDAAIAASARPDWQRWLP